MSGGGEGQLSQAAARFPPGGLLAASYSCFNETCLHNGITAHFGPGRADGAEV